MLDVLAQIIPGLFADEAADIGQAVNRIQRLHDCSSVPSRVGLVSLQVPHFNPSKTISLIPMDLQHWPYLHVNHAHKIEKYW